MRFSTVAVLALLLGVNSVFAQLTEVKVDNSAMPGADIDQVYISQSGQLVIQSVTGVEYQISKLDANPGSVVINSFTINNSTNTDLAVDAVATMRWTTTDAVSCSASTTPAEALADWNSTTVIGVSGPLNVAFPVAGDYILQLDCQGAAASTASRTVSVRVGGAVINSFTVTPDTVLKGDDVALTLEWQTTNTIACYGSSNWPNSAPLGSTSGSQVINIPAIDAGITYTLTCEGLIEGDEVVKTASVAVTTAPLACEPALQTGTVIKWTDVFRNDFPGPKSQQVRKQVPTYGYLALEFKTADIQDAGLLSNIEASGTPGQRLGSISRCAGDFDVEDVCQFVWGGSSGIYWDTTGAYSIACQLDPNETYYWNITFTDGVNPGSSGCVGSYCETYLKVWNSDYVE